VVNGDFEKPDATGKLPEGWTTRHPDNVKLADTRGPRKRVVEMTGDESLMGTYGVDLTGGKIAFKANTRYRCTGFTRSEGPSLIVFVKGYATVTKRVKRQQQTSEEPVYQMRKEIKPSREWQPFSLVFDLKPTAEFSDMQHKVEYLRITLWAYWPVGTCWYDDIRFEEVGPLPEAQRLRDDAVTHVGTKPRLSTDSQPVDSGVDEEQLWIDAANAFRAEQNEDALRLAGLLIKRDPGRGDYRVLAARAAARLQKWDEADSHARWLLDDARPTSTRPARKVETWQREWARVVRGEVLMQTGHREQGRRMLEATSKESQSPHVRAAAEKLLEGLR